MRTFIDPRERRISVTNIAIGIDLGKNVFAVREPSERVGDFRITVEP